MGFLMIFEDVWTKSVSWTFPPHMCHDTRFMFTEIFKCFCLSHFISPRDRIYLQFSASKKKQSIFAPINLDRYFKPIKQAINISSLQKSLSEAFFFVVRRAGSTPRSFFRMAVFWEMARHRMSKSDVICRFPMTYLHPPFGTEFRENRPTPNIATYTSLGREGVRQGGKNVDQQWLLRTKPCTLSVNIHPLVLEHGK